MDKLEGKKLLILGANAETVPLVEIANKMCIKTLVTSNNPNDIAKKMAWKAFDVDGLDVDGVLKLARKEKVDGVLVGVADILVPVYCKVCNDLGLPCYATQPIIDTFSYKDSFKKTCNKFQIHGIPDYYIDENLNEEDINKIVFPVMVKPVDGYSGVGMTVCYESFELKSAIEKALRHSKCKRIIVQRFMQCDDVGIYYTFKDGVCSVSCVYDRYTTDEQEGFSKVNLGSIYPSKHLDDYFKNMHDNAVRMFKEIGIQNGVLLLSGFFENGEFYMYDPGFRLQGEAPHLLMKAIHGFDQREMLIRFALTGSQGDFDIRDYDDVYFRGKRAATLWFLVKKGEIKEIQGLDDIENDSRIIANVQRLRVGDVVLDEWIGTERQVLTRLYIVCDNIEALKNCIAEYEEKIKVISTNGENMLLKCLNTDIIA